LEFRRVVFWYFTYEPVVLAAATFCSPAIEMWDVRVTIDLASENITSITALETVNNVISITQPPMNGRAYNGIAFTLSAAQQDEFILARLNATRLQLPAAVVQAAESSQTFTQDRFTQLTSQVYVRIPWNFRRYDH
jgi:hypothetical protein